MVVTIRFFASIRERVGKSDTTLELANPAPISQVWQASTGVEMPAQTLAAINSEYVSTDQLVQDGDEVAFFPPVTGG